MKVIILECTEKEKIINHFIAYGFDSIVTFGSRVEQEYYKLNGIKLICVNSFFGESTSEKLMKIRGSLNERFIIVYSSGICDFDLDELKSCHINSQCIATLLHRENRLCAVMCEEEVSDYLVKGVSFEKEILLAIGECCEINTFE